MTIACVICILIAVQLKTTFFDSVIVLEDNKKSRNQHLNIVAYCITYLDERF